MADDDSPERHAQDTERVAGGVANECIASIVAHAAAGGIDWLTRLGAMFDRDADGRIMLGREAGHSARRIVHANGDATGAEVMRALVAAVRARADLDVLSDMVAVDLITDGVQCRGVLCLDRDDEPLAIMADQVVLASGGIGGLYAHTTNPPEVAGDGLAMALRAGVEVADLEFVQFHPTTLDTGTDPAPLLTEALRGEGARLVDANGDRIMQHVHPDLELAPRDIVARAIWRAQRAGRQVLLDARSIGPDFLQRFPTVWESARKAGFDPCSEPLPVTPAAHYHMGGIATDAHGRTSLVGLWAVGEVACTGLHGANRLASNSLLEGLVIGARTGNDMLCSTRPTDRQRDVRVPFDALRVTRADKQSARRMLRDAMWEHVGIERDAAGLQRAIDCLRESGSGDVRNHLAVRNMSLAGMTIAECALARCESRGSHFRSDFPNERPDLAQRILVRRVPSEQMRLLLRCEISVA